MNCVQNLVVCFLFYRSIHIYSLNGYIYNLKLMILCCREYTFSMIVPLCINLSVIFPRNENELFFRHWYIQLGFLAFRWVVSDGRFVNEWGREAERKRKRQGGIAKRRTHYSTRRKQTKTAPTLAHKKKKLPQWMNKQDRRSHFLLFISPVAVCCWLFLHFLLDDSFWMMRT